MDFHAISITVWEFFTWKQKLATFFWNEGVGVQILQSDRKICSKQKKQGFFAKKNFFL